MNFTEFRCQTFFRRPLIGVRKITRETEKWKPLLPISSRWLELIKCSSRNSQNANLCHLHNHVQGWRKGKEKSEPTPNLTFPTLLRHPTHWICTKQAPMWFQARCVSPLPYVSPTVTFPTWFYTCPTVIWTLGQMYFLMRFSDSQVGPMM